MGRLHATSAVERGIVPYCKLGKVRLKSQVSGSDMKLMQAISGVLSTAILSLAHSMDISHLYCRIYIAPQPKRTPRII